MTKRQAEKAPEQLTDEELDEADGEKLPDREAMSVVRGVEPLPLPIVPDPPIDWE